MRNDYKLIIFDMDGTILDTLDDLYYAVNASLKNCGYPARTKEEVKAFTGKGLRYLIECSMPKNADNAAIDAVMGFFIDYYAVHSSDYTRPYDGIKETLSALKNAGYLLAVLSNKKHRAVMDLCRVYFDGSFDYILGGVDGMKLKPDPDGIERILEVAELNKSDALMVGDSEIDIMTGYNANIDVVGVSYGFRDRSVLEDLGVKNIITKPTELLELMNIK